VGPSSALNRDVERRFRYSVSTEKKRCLPRNCFSHPTKLEARHYSSKGDDGRRGEEHNSRRAEKGSSDREGAIKAKSAVCG